LNGWKLWNAIHAKSSRYICRVRDKINYEITEFKELTPADIEAGVISDQTIRTFEMICFYMSGWASLEELEAHIEKMKP